MFKALIGSLAVIGIGLFAFSPSSVYAETVNCDSAGKDLQKALDNTPPGSDVFVTGDCDTGPFFIRKDRIRLLGFGDGGATLSGPDGGNRLLGVDGDNVELRGLNLDADGFSYGIITDGTKLIITDVEVENATDTGLFLTGGVHGIVRDSEFTGNGTGLRVSGSSNGYIVGTTFTDNSSGGIAVSMSSSATIMRNIIMNNGYGILVTKMSSAAVGDNLIEGNSNQGIWVAHQYGYLETHTPPNIIQGNGVDVECADRGIFESSVAQTSTTHATSLSGLCTVLGAIF